MAALDIFIRGIDHAADLEGVGEERGDLLPVLEPAGADHGVARVPFLGEGLELVAGVLSVNGGVDLPQIRGEALAVLVGHEPQAGADLMRLMPTSA
jgi:hypothetical protein